MAPFSPSFTSTPRGIQHFSLPGNIVYYISKNPTSPKFYAKLIKLCKYFFQNNSVITLEQIWCENKCWLIFDKNEKLKSNIKNSVMETFPVKLWIFEKLDIINYDKDYSMASLLSSKLYKSDLNILNLQRQNLTLAEFKLIANPATIKKLKIRDIVVKYDENQKIVPIENIIEILPNLKMFYFLAYSTPALIKEQLITSLTAGNLAAIPHFINLKYFELYNFPETFHFETLFNNMKKPFKVDIHLNSGVLSNDYINRLQTFVVNFVKNGYPESYPPYIYFHWITSKPFNSLEKLREDYQKKMEISEATKVK